jgi:WD40 repeat protein
VLDRNWAVVARLIGHTLGISSLLPFGNQLFSGSLDQTIKLWDVETGQLAFAYHRHNERVSCLYLSTTSDNEAFLFSGSWDRTVRVWDIHRKRAVCQITVDAELAPIAINCQPESRELTVLAIPPGARSYEIPAQVHVYQFA